MQHIHASPLSMIFNPFFLVFLKISLIVALVRINDFAHQPIACAAGYTVIVGGLHFLAAAAIKMPLLEVAIYTALGALWGTLYFRLLCNTESGSDRFVYGLFGGFLLFALC